MADGRLRRAGWYVAAGGAAGGAVNALLCYLRVPVPIGDGPEYELAWHIVLAGAVHGGVLAAGAFYAARWWAPRNAALRLVGAVLVGWVAGYLSWNALSLSISHTVRAPWSLFSDGALEAIRAPLDVFGAVAGLFWLALVTRRRPPASFGGCAIPAIACGVLGSLRWWIEYHLWYFSLIHGTIWGLAVGAALWWSTGNREEQS